MGPMRPARVLSAWTCVSTLHKDLVKEYKEQPSVKVVFFNYYFC